MADNQTEGRKKNGAVPADRSDPSTPESETKRTGRKEQRSAGPDGPDATEIGDTFKNAPGG